MRLESRIRQLQIFKLISSESLMDLDIHQEIRRDSLMEWDMHASYIDLLGRIDLS